MKKLFLVLFLSIPFAVLADPRMEINDNFCHFMHDNVNDDNETFAADAGPIINVNDDTGTANGFCEVKTWMPKFLVNFELPVLLSNETFPGENCVMVESNGNEYVSDTWWSRITIAKENNFSYKLIFRIGCKDGEQQQ